MNMESARRAEEEFGAEIVVIGKTSKEYAMEKDPPPCPSVALNGRFIAINGTVSFEELKDRIVKAM